MLPNRLVLHMNPSTAPVGRCQSFRKRSKKRSTESVAAMKVEGRHTGHDKNQPHCVLPGESFIFEQDADHCYGRSSQTSP